ncbi:MAG: class I SAM-dependent methyltransferase [Burkholderiaceae bacterium]
MTPSETALERALKRIETQIRLIDWAAALLSERMPPPDCFVVEFGLGNGRTYDHLRARLPVSRIVVLDREMKANPDRRPPDDDFVKGDIAATWRTLAASQPNAASLIHADLGDGTDRYDAVLESWLGEACAALAAPGAIILSSTRVQHPAIVPMQAPFEPLGGHYGVFQRN